MNDELRDAVEELLPFLETQADAFKPKPPVSDMIQRRTRAGDLRSEADRLDRRDRAIERVRRAMAETVVVDPGINERVRITRGGGFEVNRE